MISNRREIALRSQKRIFASETAAGLRTDTVDAEGVYNVRFNVKQLSVLQRKRGRHRSAEFHAIVDTGAARSVVGLKLARRLLASQGEKLSLCPSSRQFRFGVDLRKSLGTMTIRIPTPSKILSISVDVVEPDIPFLLGLDSLDSHRLQPLTVVNLLQHIPTDGNAAGFCLDLIRLNGHAMLPFYPISRCASVYYSRATLERLHYALYHPSSRALLNLLRRADPEKLNPETVKLVEEITRSCHNCQAYSPAPISFKVSIPDNELNLIEAFNRIIKLDLMFVHDNGKSRAILHVIDVATHYQAAVFLERQDAASVWNALLSCWSRLYVGDPDVIVTDQGSNFNSQQFQSICDYHGIELRKTPTEQHNALGIGEKYHGALRKVFFKLRMDNPSMEVKSELLLQMAVFAINTSINPFGLIPTVLVYGLLPRMPGVENSGPLPQEQRFKVIQEARDEYAQWVAQMRVKLGLGTNVPSSANESYEKGDLVYVWRETPRMWTGPFRVGAQVESESDTDGRSKTVYVHIDRKGVAKPFSISRIKRAAQYLQPDKHGVNWTEVLHPSDPRSQSPEMDEAKRNELVSLLKKGTFRLVVLPDDHRENVVPSKFVLAVKNTNGEERYKARFVLRGFLDSEKHLQVHYGRTLDKTNVRILLAIAAVLGLDLWSEDLVQGYLQSAEAIKRKTFVKPEGISLGKSEFLQLVLPLYGICESGDYMSKSLSEFITRRLKFKSTPSDPNLFWRRVSAEMVQLCATYVDDLILAAPAEDRRTLQETLRSAFSLKQPSELRKGSAFEFSGMMISDVSTSDEEKALSLTMAHYIERLELLKEDCAFADYSSMRAKLLWISHCRPEIANLLQCSIRFFGRVCY